MVQETTGPDFGRDPSASNDAGLSAQAQGAAAELGRKAAHTAERMRGRAAEGLDSAARSVNAGGERVAHAAHNAADALSTSARYVRDNDLRDMVDDMLDVVRDNPGPALLGAAALGFLIGRAISRG